MECSIAANKNKDAVVFAILTEVSHENWSNDNSEFQVQNVLKTIKNV